MPKKLIYILFILIFAAVGFGKEIHYTLTIEQPHRNEFQIQIDYQAEENQQVDFAMPAWAPGYYAIRNLAKNVFDVQATGSHAQRLPIRKIDKQTWRVKADDDGKISLTYRVYSYSQGNPYSTHVSPDFAFYNGAFIFMYVVGEKTSPVQIKFRYPEGWDFHTALPEQIAEHIYTAPDYDVFSDSPTFLGNLETFAFEVQGKPHYVVMNAGYDYNQEQITTDLSKLVNWFADMFGELPYQHYTFFLRVAQPGRGGIEHLNSNVSCVTPSSLSGDLDDSDYYGDLLMLESHEFFHAFNVKRIRPTGLGPFHYTGEVYTRLLWVAEGFTSYYTHRPLVKAGIINRAKILPSWERYYNELVQNSALTVKPVSQYSFDSWIADSDIPDYTFRIFYRKGALIGMILDLDMRLRTDHEKNMDGFSRLLYEDVYKAGKTFDLEQFLALLNRYSGFDYSDFFDRYVTGLEPIPLKHYLGKVGLTLAAQQKKRFIGIKSDRSVKDKLSVYYVYPNSAADELQITRGDVIVAVNGKKVTPDSWQDILDARKVGQKVEVSWFRGSSFMRGECVIKNSRVQSYSLQEKEDLSEQEQKFLEQWLRP